jgi:hypothetical protein
MMRLLWGVSLAAASCKNEKGKAMKSSLETTCVEGSASTQALQVTRSRIDPSPPFASKVDKPTVADFALTNESDRI